MESESHLPPWIIFTGFGPFCGMPDNPCTEILPELKDHCDQVFTVDCSVEGANETLTEIYKEIDPK